MKITLMYYPEVQTIWLWMARSAFTYAFLPALSNHEIRPIVTAADSMGYQASLNGGLVILCELCLSMLHTERITLLLEGWLNC